MKEIKIILMIMALVFSSNSCDKEILKDDELTLNKTPYTGNQLRIDGYYYQIKDGKIYTVLFLFNTGIIMYGGGGWNTENIEEKEEAFQNKDWIKAVKNNKSWWGVYQIDSFNIKYEMWYPSSGGPLPAYLRSGEILNDTTFEITKSVRPKTGEEKELNEVYHFKEFSPKPDSTNSFIK